ncbi:MAG: thiamine pyrophosphate-binding protein, partial [Alphaproteobacteria bacterium]|nr:thiamine pyrophosphate-binding protein [Alphaproteobacteria bacterium]
MRNQTDGGEAVLQAFRSLGVDYVMSSPGSEWGAVWEALASQKLTNSPGPTYLSCAHETLAVNLAIGYTYVTGRMQAVMLHTGVGLLQGTMGIDYAQRHGIPMLVVSGESLSYGDNPDFDPGAQWQSILSAVGGPVRLVEPLVKWSQQVGSISTMFQQLVSAGELAQRTPAGPVYMCVPIENMAQPWDPPADLREAPPAPKTAALAADVEQVAEMLTASVRPAIITETAGRDPAAYAALVELAELLAIPVVEARWAFYANFPKDHPLHQGYHRPALIDEADLVLTVDCSAPWYPPSHGPEKARVVAVGEVPFSPNLVYQPNLAEIFLEGDTGATLALLAEAVRAAGVDEAAVADRHGHWAAAHEERIATERAVEAEAAEKSTISPAALCAALSAAAPDDTIFVDETITHRGAVLSHLRYGGPQSYFRTTGGLGQGLGVALGVKLAAPERTVISIMGDGTFMYNPVVQSLALAQHENLPILIVIFNNEGYAAMKYNHRDYYPDGVGAANDLWYGH